MTIFDLKAVIVSDYLLFALPTIEEAVERNNGEVVGVESKIDPISLNRNIKRQGANLLILAVSDDSSCRLIKDVKRKHPSIIIITITKKLRQIPMLLKTRMVKAILFTSEGTKLLIKAIKEVMKGNSYYSPKVSQEMAREIAADLTPREQEIWDLRNEDKTRGEIAKTLQISYNTVSTHIRNIEKKRIVSILI